jgi:hypothetical protein
LRQAAAGAEAEEAEWEEVMPEGMTKECNRCKIFWPVTHYPFTGANKYGKRYRRNTCKKCRSEIYKEGTKDRRAYTAHMYKLLHDPSGTFFLGVLWFKGELMATLKDGYWPPGMWWKCMKTGRDYEVQGNEAWHIQAKHMEEPNVKRVSQRLVRAKGNRQPPQKKPDGVLRRE